MDSIFPHKYGPFGQHFASSRLAHFVFIHTNKKAQNRSTFQAGELINSRYFVGQLHLSSMSLRRKEGMAAFQGKQATVILVITQDAI